MFPFFRFHTCSRQFSTSFGPRLGTCFEAILIDPLSLQTIPTHLKTPELCARAISKNGIAIKWVPSHLITPQLALIAFRNNNESFPYIPKQYHEYVMRQSFPIHDLMTLCDNASN